MSGQSATSWVARTREHFGHSRWFGGHRPDQLGDIRRDEFEALLAEREELRWLVQNATAYAHRTDGLCFCGWCKRRAALLGGSK